MMSLYIAIGILLVCAISILVIPTLKLSSKPYLPVFFVISFSVFMYFLSGRAPSLQQWVTQGKQHYNVQVQVQNLGGINGIIEKIKLRLQDNPNDTKGWLILAKLYHDNHQDDLAKQAMQKATGN